MAAPTPVQSTLYETADKIVRKVTIPAGGDADVAATTVVDISAFTSQATGTDHRIRQVWWSLSGFAVHLYFDATADVHALSMAPGSGHFDFRSINGLPNDAGSGKTGDLQFITTGVAAADDDNDDNQGFFIVEVSKEA